MVLVACEGLMTIQQQRETGVHPLIFNNKKITVRFIGDSGSASNLEVVLVVEAKRKPTRNSRAARNSVIVDTEM